VTSAQHQIEDELNPARVELSTVLTLYIDQETGQRGYGPLVSPVLAGVGWEIGVRTFGPGDSLLIFSDGVLEARDSADQEFGLDRVRAALAGSRGRPAADLVDRIRAEVRDHASRQRDDVTVLVVRRASVSLPVR
jgi:hypothetical protein